MFLFSEGTREIMKADELPIPGKGLPWRKAILACRSRINEFYKKGCQEKKFLPRPDAEKIFVSRSSPLPVSVPLDSLERLVVACFPFPWLSSSGDDDANRVLGLGKRTWYLNVNHGSIRGSWPIAISGYPRRHSVH